MFLQKVKWEKRHRTRGAYINNGYTNVMKSIKTIFYSKQRQQRKHRKTKKLVFQKNR